MYVSLLANTECYYKRVPCLCQKPACNYLLLQAGVHKTDGGQSPTIPWAKPQYFIVNDAGHTNEPLKQGRASGTGIFEQEVCLSGV